MRQTLYRPDSNKKHEVKLPQIFSYRRYDFHVQDMGPFFRVYALVPGTNLEKLIGAGDVDRRTALWRWLIQNNGQKAELLLSGDGKEAALKRVCDRYIDGGS